jgi:hypothetical protein
MSKNEKPVQVSTQKRRKWRIVALVVGGLMGLGLLCALILAFLIFRTPSPPEIQIDPVAARQFDQDFANAAAASRLGNPSIVRADEVQVNSKIQDMLAKSPSAHEGKVGSAEDIRIKFVDDHIEAYIALNYQGRRVVFQLNGKIHTLGGYTEFEPQSAKLGELPIPKSRLQAAATAMMNTPDNPLRYRLPSNMADVYMENGQVVFKMK